MTRGEHAVNEKKPAAPAGWDGLGGGDGETPIPSTELEEGENIVHYHHWHQYDTW